MSELPVARFRRTGELGERLAVVRAAARLVRGAGRFAANELLTGATAAYRLRGSKLELMVRHASSDSCSSWFSLNSS